MQGTGEQSQLNTRERGTESAASWDTGTVSVAYMGKGVESAAYMQQGDRVICIEGTGWQRQLHTWVRGTESAEYTGHGTGRTVSWMHGQEGKLAAYREHGNRVSCKRGTE